MKKLIGILLILGISFSFSCNKNSKSPGLSDQERKLLGNWMLKKQVIEEPGQVTLVNTFDARESCFMEFQEYPAPLIDNSSPIFSNTKSVQDHKDCSWLVNAWKIEPNGKLLLASLDTIYADLLFVSADSLAIRAISTNDHNILITYGLRK
jgi:hypothetical protein